MSNEIRRNMALFPIGIVMKLTDLTARQIRYYEEQGLVKPVRNEGKQRIFSLNDIDRLLEIKDLIDKGVNIAGIKEVYQLKKQEENIIPSKKDKQNQDLSDQEVRQMLKKELFAARAGEKVSLIQGQLSRFFN
ncbi:MerR family transcriptional regulator [Caldalkalibacillus mannanilyticus]|uniref:MerR family transcriptional regulator n=1 Tax=Caldalkalibacillus mannanilyticus TaxID=1418 RepID=UPI00046A0DEF|nr:MerR family transcriptional regulator [Caldalkalibacillus mannanilyticus]